MVIWNGTQQLQNGELISEDVTLTGNVEINVSSGTATVSGVISGNYDIAKTGNGILNLNGQNVYTGQTEIKMGTLKLGHTGSIEQSSKVDLTGSSAKLDIEDGDKTIKALYNIGQVRLGSRTLSLESGYFPGLFDGQGGSVEKTGTGSFTMKGWNYASGYFNLKGGELICDGRWNGKLVMSENTVLTVDGPLTIEQGLSLKRNVINMKLTSLSNPSKIIAKQIVAATGISTIHVSEAGQASSYNLIETDMGLFSTNFALSPTSNTLERTLSATDEKVLKLVDAQTVIVGAQQGTQIQGEEGTVTFPVITTGIKDEKPLQYSRWYIDPMGEEISHPPGANNHFNLAMSNVSGNAATITVTTSASIQQGIYYFRIVVDGVASNVAQLTIKRPSIHIPFPPRKSVTVDKQNEQLYAGTAGAVTFEVKTSGIADGNYAVNVANLPAGVSVPPRQSGMVTIANNSGTLTLIATNRTVAGRYSNLLLTIDGVTSEPFSLVIVRSIQQSKSVTVGAQNDILQQGIAGKVTFPVTTDGIEDGEYLISVVNLPPDVSLPVGNPGEVITVFKNSGDLILYGNTGTVAGTYSLAMILDGIQSNIFALTISKVRQKP